MKYIFFVSNKTFSYKLQLNRKKGDFYLLTICDFVYLCIEIQSVT